MKIAVVAATGRIGSKVTHSLLKAGHQVRALSRGGPALERLVKAGAEPFLASFDTGIGNLSDAFRGVDAAFLMVRTDWSNVQKHYPVVVRRFVDALKGSSVKFAVSLSGPGGDIEGSTGHFADFYNLEQALNQLEDIKLVHLRAGWFMENIAIWTDGIARYGRLAWGLEPNLKTPWVTTENVADMAAAQILNPTNAYRIVHEVSSEDLTMTELAAMIGREIGRPVEYRFVDRTRKDIQAEYLQRFGTVARWADDNKSFAALNERRVRFHGGYSPMSTTMGAFLRDVWKQDYLKAFAAVDEPGHETFETWTAKEVLDFSSFP